MPTHKHFYSLFFRNLGNNDISLILLLHLKCTVPKYQTLDLPLDIVLLTVSRITTFYTADDEQSCAKTN